MNSTYKLHINPVRIRSSGGGVVVVVAAVVLLSLLALLASKWLGRHCWPISVISDAN